MHLDEPELHVNGRNPRSNAATVYVHPRVKPRLVTQAPVSAQLLCLTIYHIVPLCLEGSCTYGACPMPCFPSYVSVHRAPTTTWQYWCGPCVNCTTRGCADGESVNGSPSKGWRMALCCCNGCELLPLTAKAGWFGSILCYGRIHHVHGTCSWEGHKFGVCSLGSCTRCSGTPRLILPWLPCRVQNQMFDDCGAKKLLQYSVPVQ